MKNYDIVLYSRRDKGIKQVGRFRTWWYNRILPQTVKETLKWQWDLISLYKEQEDTYQHALQELSVTNQELVKTNTGIIDSLNALEKQIDTFFNASNKND